MARSPLMWNQVAAPDFSAAIASQRLASDSLNRAFTGLGQGIRDFRQSTTEDADAAAMSAALRYQDPAALRAALASGGFGAPLGNISARGYEALTNRAGTLTAQDQAAQILTTSQTQDPLRTRNLQLQGTSLDLGNQQTRQNIGQSAELHPFRVQSASLGVDGQRIGNAAAVQNYNQTGVNNARGNQNYDEEATAANFVARYRDLLSNGTDLRIIQADPAFQELSPGTQRRILNSANSLTPSTLPPGTGLGTGMPNNLSQIQITPSNTSTPPNPLGPSGDPISVVRAGARARAALDPASPTYASDIARINDDVVRRSAGNIAGSRPGPNSELPGWDRGLSAPRVGSTPVLADRPPPAAADLMAGVTAPGQPTPNPIPAGAPIPGSSRNDRIPGGTRSDGLPVSPTDEAVPQAPPAPRSVMDGIPEDIAGARRTSAATTARLLRSIDDAISGATAQNPLLGSPRANPNGTVGASAPPAAGGRGTASQPQSNGTLSAAPTDFIQTVIGQANQDATPTHEVLERPGVRDGAWRGNMTQSQLANRVAEVVRQTGLTPTAAVELMSNSLSGRSRIGEAFGRLLGDTTNGSSLDETLLRANIGNVRSLPNDVSVQGQRVGSRAALVSAQTAYETALDNVQDLRNRGVTNPAIWANRTQALQRAEEARAALIGSGTRPDEPGFRRGLINNNDMRFNPIQTPQGPPPTVVGPMSRGMQNNSALGAALPLLERMFGTLPPQPVVRNRAASE